MSGSSGHFPDAFLDNSYNIPYNNIAVSHPEHGILNHAHASDVSIQKNSNTFVLTHVAALLFLFYLYVLHYSLRISRCPSTIRECSVCLGKCAPSANQM